MHVCYILTKYCMLFTKDHLDHDTIPQGMYLYAVRHHSEDLELPVQVCDWVLTNRYGSLLSCFPLEMKRHYDNRYLDIDPEKDWLSSDSELTLEAYLQQFPLPECLNEEETVKKETREERFKRLAEGRTNKAIHMIHLIGNLSSTAYAYPSEWVAPIFTALRQELDNAEKRLNERTKHKKPRFTLTDDIPAESTDTAQAPHWIQDTPFSYCCSVCGRKGEGVEPQEDQLYCQYCGNRMSIDNSSTTLYNSN